MSNEEKMKQLEQESLVLDCIKIRLQTRPWFTLEDSMLNTMIVMGNKIQNNKYFPNELTKANGQTIIKLERELAYRN